MIPFGLTKAPASFQIFFNKIFVEKFDIFIIGYMDNVFIYNDDNEDGHVTAVWGVLEQLKKYLLYANLKKCQFH